MFRRHLVAIVMDGNRFLGIATRLDLVNYFRIAQNEMKDDTSQYTRLRHALRPCRPGRTIPRPAR